MKTATVLFEEQNHTWLVIARDPEKPNYVIDTNEYLVHDGETGIILDPGGIEIFPAVVSAIAQRFDPEKITQIFASHQDPDIISSIGLWLDFNNDIKCRLSWLWAGFIPHFGGTAETFQAIPDEGCEIQVGKLRLQAVPAHYLHSSGNFNIYDPAAKVFFSGDIGAALLPPEKQGIYVTNFDDHVRYAEGFHKRWMGSNEAKNDWCDRVGAMDIKMLCPQHGAIYRGADVARFIQWFRDLEVGLHTIKRPELAASH